ncbi:hypothetical protein [Herbiconiux liukaitaii]
MSSAVYVAFVVAAIVLVLVLTALIAVLYVALVKVFDLCGTRDRSAGSI